MSGALVQQLKDQAKQRIREELADRPRVHRLVRAARRPRHTLTARRRRHRQFAADQRLAPSPVFVICSVRSGSTLLRVVLNSHPKICAPHELHLGSLRIDAPYDWAKASLDELGLDEEELQFMLWDRILHRELQRSGKDLIVEKTPGDALLWPQLRRCWPDARYIFLLRHPMSILQSYMDGRDDRPLDSSIKSVSRYFDGIESARENLPGITVTYEDLVDDPEAVTRQICGWLGVRWSRRMLDYGRNHHGRFRAGIGDWSHKIRSGQIQPGRPSPTPEEIPEALQPYARTWGYLPQ
jgi:hypothetical protein